MGLLPDLGDHWTTVVTDAKDPDWQHLDRLRPRAQSTKALAVGGTMTQKILSDAFAVIPRQVRAMRFRQGFESVARICDLK